MALRNKVMTRDGLLMLPDALKIAPHADASTDVNANALIVELVIAIALIVERNVDVNALIVERNVDVNALIVEMNVWIVEMNEVIVGFSSAVVAFV